MIPVSRPTTYNMDAISYECGPIMDSAWFTNDGPLVRRFEEELSIYLQVPQFVAMSSGTLALEAAVSVVFPKGATVAIPSYTFVAVASSLVRCGLRPYFVDIDLGTWTMDFDQCTNAMVRSAGFLVPTVFGVLPDERFKTSGLLGILDNAEGFGKVKGLFGLVDVYSFHATKVMTSGEGGGIACNSGYIWESLRAWRNFGFDGLFPAPEIVGTNAKMSEFHAAIGGLSWGQLEHQLSERNRLLGIYREELMGAVQFQDGEPYNCVVLVENRDKIAAFLAEHGIDSRPYFYPIHLMPAYRHFVRGGQDLPVTEYVAARALALPLWAGLMDEQVRHICQVIKEAL
jgi:dTDP-4-amino-4,6-dideoxygalactose transaminase